MKHKEVWIVICALCASLCLCSSLCSYVLTRNDGRRRALAEATELLQARRFEEAEAATRKILDANPRNADARALLALILDQRGQQAEAEHEYQAALKLKPNHVSALSNFGVLSGAYESSRGSDREI